MTKFEHTDLVFVPDNKVVPARIVELTPRLFRARMGPHWWDDPQVVIGIPPPIDLDWKWFDPVERDGIVLACNRYAVITRDGQVQGAILVSTEPLISIHGSSAPCLVIDQLCTAPRNRPGLRRDNSKWYAGVGTKLLQKAGRLSAAKGLGGRLWLLASPEGESVYRWLGFERIKIASEWHEGIEYHQMELPDRSVDAFFQK